MTTPKYRVTLVLTVATVLAAAACFYFACDNPVTSEEAQQEPRNLQASFTGAAVKLTWEPSERNEETGYEVWRSQGNNTSYQKLAGVGKDKREYADGAIELEKTYYYKVRTVYGGDPGKFSNEVKIETTTEAPRNLKGEFTGTSVKLTWEASISGKETGYEVWRKLGAGTYGRIATLSKGTLAFEDRNITFEKTFYYKIKAVLSNKPGKYSNEVPVFTGYEKQPPRNLVANFTGNAVRLTWDGSVGGNETGYEVWRKLSSSTYVRIATRTRDERSFNDNNIGTGKYYYYKVGTIYYGNKIGQYSNEVEVYTAYLWNADFYADKILKINPNTGNVVGSVPAPGPFPEDLAWDGASLWNVDGERATIYRLNPNTGSILSSFATPGLVPIGLAWDGNYLWNSDYFKDMLFKINPYSGSVVGSFPSPAEYPEGLAWDGSFIWNTACPEAGVTCYKINPNNGSVVKSFRCVSRMPSGLAWDGTFLWTADAYGSTNTIYKISPNDGRVVSSFPSPGDGPSGLAFRR